MGNITSCPTTPGHVLHVYSKHQKFSDRNGGGERRNRTALPVLSQRRENSWRFDNKQTEPKPSSRRSELTSESSFTWDICRHGLRLALESTASPPVATEPRLLLRQAFVLSMKPEHEYLLLDGVYWNIYRAPPSIQAIARLCTDDQSLRSRMCLFPKETDQTLMGTLCIQYVLCWAHKCLFFSVYVSWHTARRKCLYRLYIWYTLCLICLNVSVDTITTYFVHLNVCIVCVCSCLSSSFGMLQPTICLYSIFELNGFLIKSALIITRGNLHANFV